MWGVYEKYNKLVNYLIDINRGSKYFKSEPREGIRS